MSAMLEFMALTHAYPALARAAARGRVGRAERKQIEAQTAHIFDKAKDFAGEFAFSAERAAQSARESLRALLRNLDQPERGARTREQAEHGVPVETVLLVQTFRRLAVAAAAGPVGEAQRTQIEADALRDLAKLSEGQPGVPPVAAVAARREEAEATLKTVFGHAKLH